MVDRKEAEQAKKTRMEQKRLAAEVEKEEKIVMRLYEKQNRLTGDTIDVSQIQHFDHVNLLQTRSNVTSMQSSARMWRGIAKADRDQNMIRNKEVQKAYKQKLIEDLINKEQRYFRAKKLKENNQNSALPPHPIYPAYQ